MNAVFDGLPDARSARDIMRAIGDGVPPHRDLVQYITVGQKETIERFRIDLSACAAGEYRSLALLGNPGMGKTHLLNALGHLGLKSNFVVSHFTQDLATKCTVNRLDRTFAALCEALTAPERQIDGDVLEAVLRRWAYRTVLEVGGAVESLRYLGQVCDAKRLGSEFADITGRTKVVLLGLLAAAKIDDDESILFFVNAFRSVSIENRAIVERAKAIGLNFYRFFAGYTPATSDSSFYIKQIGILADIVSRTGYSGLIVMCDEATGTAELVTQSRKKAYDVIRDLLVNQYDLTSCYFVLAFMPAFIVQLRNDRSAKLSCFDEHWMTIWEQQQYRVPELKADELASLGERISVIQKIASGDDVEITDARSRSASFSGTVREWVRGTTR